MKVGPVTSVGSSGKTQAEDENENKNKKGKGTKEVRSVRFLLLYHSSSRRNKRTRDETTHLLDPQSLLSSCSCALSSRKLLPRRLNLQLRELACGAS